MTTTDTMGLLTRFIGGDRPSTQWQEGEVLEGTYMGYQQIEYAGKPLPMFHVMEENGTVVRFLATSQLMDLIYLPAGRQIQIEYIGKSTTSNGFRVKDFRIRADTDLLLLRKETILEQLRNPGSRLALPEPIPGLPTLVIEGDE